MKILIICLILVIIALILAILYFINVNKINKVNKRICMVEKDIKEQLNKKYKNMVKINSAIKKTLHAKKDYLIGLNDINPSDTDLSELDIMLNDINQTVKNLESDYTKISSNKEIRKIITNNEELDELLVANKRFFNKNTKTLSTYYTSFPSNIICKLNKIKINTLFEGVNLK